MRWQGLYQFQIKFALTVVLLINLHPVCSSGGENNDDLQHRQQQQYKSPPTPPNIKVTPGGGAIKQPRNGDHLPSKSSYAMLSEAMSQAVNHEFNDSPDPHPHPSGGGGVSMGGSASNSHAEHSCSADGLECHNYDPSEIEAIKSLHRQLDDDDNGDIDLSESDDFLREELKYDSGYEKRHKAFHFNDDMHISVKELWEAWLRSEVHNWTVDQSVEWLVQSVQLPQYVRLFRQHKINGRILPRLAVNNLHYVSSVLGIKDPIHKQKIALKAMDVVLFGPPRETGTRWKDLLLVALVMTAIIGYWYFYNVDKSSKAHLKRMAQEMEQLQKAEYNLQSIQKELERAKLEQEHVGKEKLDLERRLKEQPTLTSVNSDLEKENLRQEIERLRAELSKAECERNDHCWTPPQGLQQLLQYTYEIETNNYKNKRNHAERQLNEARVACEKLRKKRTSLIGAFVTTHGKTIDDVDRIISEARTAMGEVTVELSERAQRWKQIERMLSFNIINNNINSENSSLYRNGKGSRTRMTSSQDSLDDDSLQGGFIDSYRGRDRFNREDSSASDEIDQDSVVFTLGDSPVNVASPQLQQQQPPMLQHQQSTASSQCSSNLGSIRKTNGGGSQSSINATESVNTNNTHDDSGSISSTTSFILPPRMKKPTSLPRPPSLIEQPSLTRAPMPPPRRTNSQQSITFSSHLARSQSGDLVAMESPQTQLHTTASIAAYVPSNHVDHHQQQSIQHHLEDTYSTDSSSLGGDETKRRRKKLHFPFTKKSKSKNA